MPTGRQSSKTAVADSIHTAGNRPNVLSNEYVSDTDSDSTQEDQEHEAANGGKIVTSQRPRKKTQEVLSMQPPLREGPVVAGNKQRQSTPYDDSKRRLVSGCNEPQEAPISSTHLPAPFCPPGNFQSVAPKSGLPPIIPWISSEANFGDKQIWHVVIPSSVPLVAVEETPRGNKSGTAAIMSHTGVSYTFGSVSSPQTGPYHIMTPLTKENKFKFLALPIKKALTLHQATKTFSTEDGSQNSEQISKFRARSKARPQQPVGLKMRHTPLGVALGSPKTPHEPPIPTGTQTGSARTGPQEPSQPFSIDSKGRLSATHHEKVISKVSASPRKKRKRAMSSS